MIASRTKASHHVPLLVAKSTYRPRIEAGRGLGIPRCHLLVGHLRRALTLFVVLLSPPGSSSRLDRDILCLAGTAQISGPGLDSRVEERGPLCRGVFCSRDSVQVSPDRCSEDSASIGCPIKWLQYPSGSCCQAGSSNPPPSDFVQL